jgi:RNA polymerase sigma-70 factor (ECF subfamily)
MLAPSFDYEANLAACARGSQAALRDLYHQESPRMLALAMRTLADSSAAQAIVRDAFVLVWKNAASYDPEAGTARAWIYSIMRYRIMNRLRQSGRPTPAMKVGWQANLPAASTTDEIPSLVRTLDGLDKAQRLPVLMAYYGGLNYEQIASVTQVPQEQVRTHVHEALEAILEALSA